MAGLGVFRGRLGFGFRLVLGLSDFGGKLCTALRLYGVCFIIINTMYSIGSSCRASPHHNG